MSVKILSIASHLPKKRVSNDELSSLYNIDTTDEWIRSHTGIESRYIADDSESCVELAYRASIKALESAGVRADELGMIIMATSTPDFKSFPSSASVLQDRLGADQAGAFDLTAGCTGFIYGLEVGQSLVESSDKKILIVGAEKLTSMINWNDRNTCVLFGDGAGAAVLGRSDSSDSLIIDSYLRSEGSGHESLIITDGGSVKPFKLGDTMHEKHFVQMDGQQVYKFAVRTVSNVIEKLLEKHDLNINDLKYIVPHQANKRIIQAAAKRLGYDIDKFYINIEKYANTSAASVPIALSEMVEKKLLLKGDLILTVGFGAGLTYGGNLFRW